jgi:NitT/TauT family transport system substrate-binding protein
MKRKIISLLLTTTLALTALTGCGQTGSIAETAAQEEENTNTDENTNAEETDAAETADTEQAADEASDTEEAATQDKGTLKVSFMTGNIRIAINILALEKGYFAEEGVTVEPVNIGGQDALTAINGSDDQLDILNTGFVPDLQAIGSGYDITVIGGTAVEGGAVITKSGNAATYQDASTIINLDAVKEAKLGFIRNESAWVVTRQYLLDNGVSEEEIAAIEDEANGNISYYQDETAVAQAVQKGEVDLGFLPMEYALLYGDAYELEVVTPAGSLQENYVCCREVTSPAKLAEKHDAFVAYETARIRAFDYYKQGETDETIKQDVVDTVANYSGKEADYVETYLYGGVTKYATDPNTKGIVKYVEAATNSGLLASAGIDFATYDITQNIDVSAYEEAINALVEREPDNQTYAELLTQFEADNK